MNLVWSGNGKEAEEAGTQEIDNEVEDVSGGSGECHNLWVLVS